ncbi:MAG: hypothetical protein J5594_03445 [Elusimicrobiaceae bacterium]|nr:hypothetical protein [Elusimicrobiaceae bacterium]
MKVNKFTFILGILLIPVFVSAQENKTGNNILTEINDSGVTFTIPDITLDSIDIVNIKQDLNKQVEKIETRNKFIYQLIQQISDKCQNITDEQTREISKNMSEYMMLYKIATLPEDIKCNEKSLFALRVSYQQDEGFEWYNWHVEVYEINTGKYLTRYKGELNNKINTFDELISTGDFPPKDNSLRTKQIFQ